MSRQIIRIHNLEMINTIFKRGVLTVPDDWLQETYFNPSVALNKALLAVHLAEAFNNVTHDGIIEELTRTDCGGRTYNYLKIFLTRPHSTHCPWIAHITKLKAI
ncbi:hypothetical protein HPB48_026714 [Haemaphysalis longicornis]|uniref:Uncharacterized protein n=1 Tax=Haemaphysalis longicornis TaxID=44386 RepID=A0A9J6H1U6_HAELO|nr:hypothetical protein HPB48_026714 [Haemaphysalis longicornis]